ncbi:MAG: hypothetical protein V7631_3105 [Massilia sp.]|jgi:hypothetical protein
MTTEHLSCAAGDGINEDLIRVFTGAGLTDILVLDGATSVADRNYIEERQGDVAWFTHAFADALAPVLTPDLPQAQAVHAALESVRRSWQLAAMTWIRIRECEDHLADAYGLYTQEDLGRRCRQDRIEPLMRELRAFETARAAGATMAVRSADDASAVIWTACPPAPSSKDRT